VPIKPENVGRYPADWKLRSRFVRFYRAKNRCEWCGADNGKPHPVTGSTVVLTVAHVYDDAPENSSLLNLAALCQRCHLNHDREIHMRNRQISREQMAGQKRLIP
jgi:5-methylcytosine-specific restriction endonuclease McrA